MRNLMIALTYFVCVLMLPQGLDAQVRKKSTASDKKSKEKKEKVDFTDKLNPEIKFGNLGFFNGLYISSKLDVGYKLHERFTAGAGAKLFYNQVSIPNSPDPSIFDAGGFLFGRAKITNEIYFQGEYAFMTYSKDPDGFRWRDYTEPQKVNSPLVGLGYMSGSGNWRFGIEILYITNEVARDIQNSIVEYWFGASYHF